MASKISAADKLAQALKALSPAEVQAALQAAGMAPQRTTSRKALTLPADADKQGRAIIGAYNKLAADGKAPRIGENSVRAFMLMVAATVGYSDDADGRIKVACAQVADGKPIGGSVSFAGFSSEDPFRRRHYMGKVAEEWIARKQADGMYRLVRLGQATSPANPRGKATGGQAALAAPSTSSTSKAVKHACGAVALLGSTCRNCKAEVTAETSFDRATGEPLVKPRKARKPRDASRSNGKVVVVQAPDASTPTAEPTAS